jgi:hypothetical protein
VIARCLNQVALVLDGISNVAEQMGNFPGLGLVVAIESQE